MPLVRRISTAALPFGGVKNTRSSQLTNLPFLWYRLGQCLIIDPDDRPSAEELLHHEFLQKYSEDETLHEVGTAVAHCHFLERELTCDTMQWLRFIEEKQLSDDREADLDAFADSAYRHLYERCAKFSYQPQVCATVATRNVRRSEGSLTHVGILAQSDFGMSFMSQATPTYSRRMISIEPIQMRCDSSNPRLNDPQCSQEMTLLTPRSCSFCGRPVCSSASPTRWDSPCTLCTTNLKRCALFRLQLAS